MSAEVAFVPGAATPRVQEAPRPVAVLLSRFPTVTETFILREVIELERQGQPVTLVPMLKDSPPVIHDAAKPWIDRAVYTWYLSPAITAANLRALANQPLRYISLYARLFLGTILRPGTFARTLAVFPKSVFLAEKLRADGVRHIHAHFATHPTTMALIISTLAPEITFSFTVHAHDIQLDRSLLRWKLREARFIRSISAFNKRFLEEKYPNETRGKISVIHVGIEPEIYEHQSRTIRPVTGGAPRILCVAAHRPYKGLPVLIEACRILRDQGVHARCDVVGTGPMTAELEQMIRDRNLSDTFRLLGARPQEEVARLMAEATLFALPSIIAADGQMEGIPVALMEAMASGKAVVSTTLSGIPELVESGTHGLLVAPGDAGGLAGALRTLLEDPARAKEMGARGQEKVRAEFTLRGCVAELMELLRAEARS
ncbi:MAG TPA: glycosyltransferase family 4 protein [Thermoanaerobaculia bacterium]|nr:glycosyltransferase family 4 protein [Thermoanaerobaculia bacterium]